MTDVITAVEPQEPEVLDSDQFLKFLAAIPDERDLTSWLAWLNRPTKKVAIVGFTSSRQDVPWDDPTWEIWICNDLHLHVPDKWDRLYDLHDLATIREKKEHDGFLRTATKPVYVFTPQPEWPSAVPFPKDEINERFGKYFTNSISWMVAHAIMEGVTELGIWGVDLATGTEYAGQRPSCEYFLGFAAGRGVKVYIPPASDLLKIAFQYGAEDDSPVRAKWNAREKELTDRLNALQGQHGQITNQVNQLMGALEQVRYDKTVWLSPAANRDGSAKSINPSDNQGAGNGSPSP